MTGARSCDDKLLEEAMLFCFPQCMKEQCQVAVTSFTLNMGVVLYAKQIMYAFQEITKYVCIFLRQQHFRRSHFLNTKHLRSDIITVSTQWKTIVCTHKLQISNEIQTIVYMVIAHKLFSEHHISELVGLLIPLRFIISACIAR